VERARWCHRFDCTADHRTRNVESQCGHGWSMRPGKLLARRRLPAGRSPEHEGGSAAKSSGRMPATGAGTMPRCPRARLGASANCGSSGNEVETAMARDDQRFIGLLRARGGAAGLRLTGQGCLARPQVGGTALAGSTTWFSKRIGPSCSAAVASGGNCVASAVRDRTRTRSCRARRKGARESRACACEEKAPRSPPDPAPMRAYTTLHGVLLHQARLHVTTPSPRVKCGSAKT
jgi:hypothetical protein